MASLSYVADINKINPAFSFAKKVQIESRTCQACLSNYAEMQPFLCKITQFLSYKHQNHQKIIQYSDNQQLYTPFRTISGAKLRNTAKVMQTESNNKLV